MKFKAVLFDLDGTLANSLYDLADSVNYTLAKNGFPIHETDAYKYFVGNGIPTMLRRAMPQNEGDEVHEKLVKEFLEYYSIHSLDKTAPYEGIKELVYDLKSAGIKVAVVTNKAQEAAETVVKKLFGDVFDCVMGLSPGVPAKPDPTSALMVMEKLGVEPKDCAFIGDTSVDITVGVKSGAFTVGVLYGFRKKEELEAAGAKIFAKNADELREILI